MGKADKIDTDTVSRTFNEVAAFEADPNLSRQPCQNEMGPQLRLGKRQNVLGAIVLLLISVLSSIEFIEFDSSLRFFCSDLSGRLFI